MYGYDSLLGSHFDKYYVDYTDYNGSAKHKCVHGKRKQIWNGKYFLRVVNPCSI